LNIKILSEAIALEYLKKENVNLNEFSYEDDKGVLRFDREKSPTELTLLLDKLHEGGFNDRAEINLEARIAIIKYYFLNELNIIKNLNRIKNGCGNRNLISHNIKNINESDFCLKSKEICNSFEKLFSYIFGIDKFDVYHVVNEKICESLF
jgi:hypothetical protein